MTIDGCLCAGGASGNETAGQSGGGGKREAAVQAQVQK